MSDTETPSDDQTEFVIARKGGRVADSGWPDECPDHLPPKSDMKSAHADIIEAAASDQEWDSFAELARSIDSVEYNELPAIVLRSFWIERAVEISYIDHDLAEYRQFDPQWGNQYDRSDYDPLLESSESLQIDPEKADELVDGWTCYLQASGVPAKQIDIDSDDVQAMLNLADIVSDA